MNKGKNSIQFLILVVAIYLKWLKIDWVNFNICKKKEAELVSFVVGVWSLSNVRKISSRCEHLFCQFLVRAFFFSYFSFALIRFFSFSLELQFYDISFHMLAVFLLFIPKNNSIPPLHKVVTVIQLYFSTYPT